MKKQGIIFSVIGVVIVIVGVIYFLGLSQSDYEWEKYDAETPEGIAVSTKIKECLDLKVRDAIMLTGLQGGYTEVKSNYLETQHSNVSYYYNDGQITVPSIDVIENEMENYISKNVGECVKDFESTSTPKLDVRINVLSGMVAALNYSIKVGEESLDVFHVSYSYPVGTMRNVAEEIIGKVSEYPQMIPQSDIVTSGRKYKLDVNTFNYGSEDVVYVIEDTKNMVGADAPLMLLFAVRSTKGNTPPEIFLINQTQLNGVVGEQMLIQLDSYDADNDLVKFDDDSDMFDINTYTGEIDFVPYAAGEHKIIITATDGVYTIDNEIVIRVK